MRLSGREVQEMAPLPVPVPPSVEQQRAQGRQRVAAALPPLHPAPFLPARHNAVVGFLAQPAADVAALAAPRPIAGNPGRAGLQVGTQLVYRRWIGPLPPLPRQETAGAG